MDSTMEGMLDTYLLETESLLDKLDEMLIAAEKVGDFSTDDVNEIFRIMHTIKGSSAMMEFTPISSIAHHIEDMFFFIRDKGIDSLNGEQKRELFDLMFRSEDYLRSGLEKVKAGEELDNNVDAFAGEINGFLAKISGKDGDNSAAGAASTQTASASGERVLPNDPTAKKFIHVFLDEGIGMENLRAFMIVNAIKEFDLEFRYYPEDMDSNPETAQSIIDSGFFLAFDNDETLDKGEKVLREQSHILSYEIVEGKKEEVKKEETGNAKESTPKAQGDKDNGNAQQAAQQKSAAPVKQSLISVNLQKLDSLNDLVGEIVITESMVTSSPVLRMLPQESLDNFMKSARQLRKLTDDLQDIAMSLRMVSISGVFQKMNRIVRDMKQKLGKEVKLTIIGEDTEVDKTIVDSIQDPLMHIVRNSMDHGIEETKEERIAAGKDAEGELTLSAFHTSSEVIITVADDGYGMNPEKLLDKAEEKGLLYKPRSEYSKKEALGLIMLPGFSTNQSVTEFSGRGVGMDVVKKNLESVGGTISISSELGKGSTFTMKIPLTLAIMDGMKVNVGDSIFTIPIVNIRQSFKVDDAEVVFDENGNEMVKRMDVFYPIVRLNNFYGIEGKYTDLADGVLIWVEANDKSCCLFVDDLIGEQQVVVKPLPAYFNAYNLKDSGINGCSILGDGNICIILDVLGLYSQAIENN
ncbi:chemotaxis protein CheA [Oribacterium sp. oral taxon 108]|uniref:chemotaxis protein CheA n=1 Tax=Oribacterium sp. oral taxon 108 TaxID=712414 RepID=UPI00020DDE8A|nr:chemotaxis protein CheA [Oribacterium sp. oral taxon 108]EGL36685.1 ATPase/histidine kinase/DNA gyrase B/HSP90 domain protein [Oribacterium sp. oral taxon 108 str. F0425]